MEILKQKDPSVRAESFRILRIVWGEEDEWIKQVECKAVIEAGYFASMESAGRKADELRKEILGLGDSGAPGYGSKAMLLKKQLEQIKKEQEFYTQRIQECGKFVSGGGF